jgi:hypothetical protein
LGRGEAVYEKGGERIENSEFLKQIKRRFYGDDEKRDV